MLIFGHPYKMILLHVFLCLVDIIHICLFFVNSFFSVVCSYMIAIWRVIKSSSKYYLIVSHNKRQKKSIYFPSSKIHSLYFDTFLRARSQITAFFHLIFFNNKKGFQFAHFVYYSRKETPNLIKGLIFFSFLLLSFAPSMKNVLHRSFKSAKW